jgi:hypothetical protein
VAETHAEVMHVLHKLQGDNFLKEQLEAVLGHITDPEERVREAFSLIHGYFSQSGREEHKDDLPEALQMMYS